MIFVCLSGRREEDVVECYPVGLGCQGAEIVDAETDVAEIVVGDSDDALRELRGLSAADREDVRENWPLKT